MPSDIAPVTHQLILMPSGLRGPVEHGMDVLHAARTLGVELESICGGRQTCGKCQVVVEEGRFPKHAIASSSASLSPIAAVEAEYCTEHGIVGRRLACAAQVVGDVLITVPEESQARKQIIAKAATERSVVLHPAVRQVYVEVELAGLEDRRSDWQRVAAALESQWQVHNPVPDVRVLPGLQAALRTGEPGVMVSLWRDSEVLRVDAGYCDSAYGLAVDIGSTTVVAHLCDLRTGALLGTQAMMNPQVRYGEDLMSRVSYGMMEPQGVARLHRAAIQAVNELAERVAAAAGLSSEDILDAVIVGNSVMHHLFLGIDPVELGGAPFALAVDTPLDLKARDLGLRLHPAARVHVLPCIAGHVGADHVAVLLAEAPHTRDELALVIDVGTNAEISLADRERILCASSPTGPAFEGAQISHGQRAAAGAIERVRVDPESGEPRYKVLGHEAWIEADTVGPLPEPARATGICGSGIVEVVAELFLAGILDSDGRFNEAAAGRNPRVRFPTRAGEYVLAEAGLTATEAPIIVTQNDVRAIQLAKAALYAGTKLLMAHRGVDHVDRIALAGAFGSYLSPRHAMILGMIPDCDLERVTAVGNAAGDGARLALLSTDLRDEAAHIQTLAEHVQIATDASFQDEFVAAMAFPNARDAFPHLVAVLPKRGAPLARRSQRRRPVNAGPSR
ncbi:MAG: ASKHA domain-containing protein [Anaerolineales bacterium]